MSPMAEDRYVSDRLQGLMDGAHPRLLEDGASEMILTPEDTLEGSGDFLSIDQNADPEGWKLGRPENPVARHLYAGRTRGTMVRVLHRSIGRDRSSVVLDFPLPDQGASPPNADTPRFAKIPRPEKPRGVVQPSAVAGYAASTPQSPHWYAWARRDPGGSLSLAGLAVPFHGKYGQSYRVPIPEEFRVAGGGEYAILMAEPGTSTPTSPGPMWVQRTIDLAAYPLPYYDLTGPYRRETPAPTTNLTVIGRAGWPTLDRDSAQVAARVGTYRGRITWTDANGESLPSPGYDETVVASDSRYTRYDDEGAVEVLAGRGYVTATRQLAPPGATGWRLYLYFIPPGAWTEGSTGTAGWTRAVNRFTGEGGEKPFSLRTRTIYTAGWTGSEEPYGVNDTVILEQVDLPTQNTTGLRPPEGEPEPPEAMGVSRPAPGPMFFCTTDVLETGAESLPSEVEKVEVGAQDVAVAAFVNPENRYANPTFVETDPNELPLHWQINRTGGDVRVIGEDLVLWTNGVQTGLTPEAMPNLDEAAPTKESVISGAFVVEHPEMGQAQGSVEVVWRQISTAGVATDTVILTATQPGESSYNKIVAPAGAIPGAGVTLQWLASTVSHTTLHRFSGTSKNKRVRIRRAEHRRHRHGDRRRKKKEAIRPDRPPPPSTEPPEEPVPPGPPVPPVPPVPPALPPALPPKRPRRPPIPPGYDTNWQDPPEPPWSPEAAVVPYPDRMPVSGVVEQTLGFEGGLTPLTAAGWTETLSGNATLTTTAAAAMTGSLGLRVNKPTAGALSSGYYSKTLLPESEVGAFAGGGRHGVGLYHRYRLPLFPVNGEIVIRQLCRPSDGAWFAELRASAASEISEITLLEEPVSEGNAVVGLDGVMKEIPVNATVEVAKLTMTSAPNASGTATLEVMGETRNFAAGGERGKVKLSIYGTPGTDGVATLVLGERTHSFPLLRLESVAQLVSKIRQHAYPGWRISGEGATILFTADLPGPHTDATFSANTRLSFAISTLTQGISETLGEFVTRIKGVSYQDAIAETEYDGGGAPTPDVVLFRARTAGPHPDSSYSPGTTGALGTMETITQGSIETKEQVAARIRGTVFNDPVENLFAANQKTIGADLTGFTTVNCSISSS